MTTEEKYKIIDDVVAWGEKHGIDIMGYKGDCYEKQCWPSLSVRGGCYYRVGDRTWVDDYLETKVYDGQTAEEIEKLIQIHG